MARLTRAYARGVVRHEQKRAKGQDSEPPAAPRELIYAMRVTVDHLRPWEYDAMDADKYDMILHLQGVFREELQSARQAVERAETRRRERAQRPR